jgi:hypothetical protein
MSTVRAVREARVGLGRERLVGGVSGESELTEGVGAVRVRVDDGCVGGGAFALAAGWF